MKRTLNSLRNIGLLSLLILFLPAIADKPPDSSGNPSPLREAAYRVLATKCNSCHRKRNPFMVFKPKNMDRRATRIYRAVYLQKRMPKAGGAPLTQAESDTLRQWLETKFDQP
ncbi:MAG: hypothetical protein AAGF89_10345 [Bacteroidota bacterium]